MQPSDLCRPMLHRPAFTRSGWLFELKHDGFRAFVRTGRTVELLSRQGRSMKHAFPELLSALRALPEAVLDAELVVPDARAGVPTSRNCSGAPSCGARR